MDGMSDSNWKKIVYLICMIQVGAGVAIIGVLAFLPLFLRELGVGDAGEAALWAGIIAGVTPLMIAVSSPFWAVEADRRGPKTVLSIVLIAVATSAFLCSISTSPWEIFLWRIMQGLVGGFVPIGLAVIVAVTPEEYTSQAMGYFQAALVAGMMFGPLIGGFTADVLGYRMPFVVFGVLALLCLVALRVYLPDLRKRDVSGERTSTWKEIKFFSKIPRIRIMVGLQFLCNFGVTGIGPILPLYISQLMGGEVAMLATVVGTIIFLAGGASAVCSVSLARLTERFKLEHLLLFATSFIGITFVLQYWMPDVWGLGFFRTLTGFGLGMIMPIANTLIAKATPPEKRTIVFGVVSGVALMGNVAGPVFSGALAMMYGYGSVFWSTAMAFWVAAWIIYHHFFSGSIYTHHMHVAAGEHGKGE